MKMNETIQSTEITTTGCINKHKHQWARRPAIQNQHFSSPRKRGEENNEKWVYLYHLHLLILFCLLMILNYKDSIDGKWRLLIGNGSMIEWIGESDETEGGLSENQIVASFVTGVWTVDGSDSWSIKVPVSNSNCNTLIPNKRRIIGKPCILPLCLAMSETWIYE